MPTDYPRVDLFLSFMRGMRSNFDWVVYRFIALAVFGLVASVEAQVVCRKNKDGVLVWSSRPSCPTGHSPVQKFIRANMMADNSVGTSQIADGAVTDSKIASVSWNKVQVSDNQIPWSKINTSNASIQASQIQGQITNEQIQSVNWNKVQVSDNQIPWSKINTSNASLNANQIQGQITNEQIQSVRWNKVQVQDNEIPWSKINTSNASLNANQIQGQITNEQIQSVRWNKVQVNDNEIPLSRINFSDVLTRTPFYQVAGASSMSLLSSTGASEFLFPVGRNAPATSMVPFMNVFKCKKFKFTVIQNMENGPGARRRFGLIDHNDNVIAHCDVVGGSKECSAEGEFTQAPVSFLLAYTNSQGNPIPTHVSWVILCTP
ncbi:MAG: hypothetical protein N2654_02755 [Deltaproteobacteria bacterium]|nr:hypothetical protein [Deltaproteobacteria bacterium]